jgi:hypothetical protein
LIGDGQFDSEQLVGYEFGYRQYLRNADSFPSARSITVTTISSVWRINRRHLKLRRPPHIWFFPYSSAIGVEANRAVSRCPLSGISRPGGA